MRVTGLLAWYDEEPGHLARCVSSLAAHGVDHLVALDGAYRLYPMAQPSSPRDQQDAILEAALDAGLTAEVHVPREPFRNNEIEKRTRLFDLAHATVEPGRDWLLVIDADEVIATSDDYRDQLAATNLDVATVVHDTNGLVHHERRFFRAHRGGIRVERAHFVYMDGDDRVLWGPQQIPADDVDVHMLHLRSERLAERIRRRDAYYHERTMTHSEEQP